VWRYHEPWFATSQPGEILEGFDLFRSMSKVNQQNVASLNGSLDAGEQHHATLGRVRDETFDGMLTVVKCDCQRPIPERRRTVDQLFCGIRNLINGIVGRVRVKFDFEHGR
jgi:hypothetical protein